jgi:excisionase family DNA binding protein
MALPDPRVQPTLTVEEAAVILGIGRGTAYEAVQTGALPGLRIGRRLLIPTAAIHRLLGFPLPELVPEPPDGLAMIPAESLDESLRSLEEGQ